MLGIAGLLGCLLGLDKMRIEVLKVLSSTASIVGFRTNEIIIHHFIILRFLIFQINEITQSIVFAEKALLGMHYGAHSI